MQVVTFWNNTTCKLRFKFGDLKAVLGRAMAQAVSRRPLTVAARVNPVGFVVDKVALGQVFLRVPRFFPVNIIPPWVPHFRKLKNK
jgi:hypothetical protein